MGLEFILEQLLASKAKMAKKKVLIATDSLHCLNAIRKPNKKTLQGKRGEEWLKKLKEVRETICQLSTILLELKMLWIPGHIGIIDHEMADKGASFARVFGDIDKSFRRQYLKRT